MTEPLHRITLRKPANLGPCTRALVEHGFTPWSFWEDGPNSEHGDHRGAHIIVQFHAPRDVNLDFLRPMILKPK